MNRGELYSRIAAQLDVIGRTPKELMSYMAGRGIRYDLAWIEVFIQPDDVTPIAEFLKVKPSFLFFATGFKDHLLRSIVREIWDEYKDRISYSESEVVSSVIDSEHRLANSLATLEQEIRLAIETFCSDTSGRFLACVYPDCSCERRQLHCDVDGHMLGPED